MGKVAIEGMEFQAFHGVHPTENSLGRQFVVDVYVDLDLEEAAIEENLDATVDYEWVYQTAKREMRHTQKLLETTARRIGWRIKGKYPKASHVLVRISKMAPFVGGKTDRAFVEFEIG